ncbi:MULTISPECIES: beta-galactosidase [unclassified Sphingobacterium]|uniref:beta-galactosidase n=1 Tax=unclassified Sphingobacterium TaxID=2609468 RepID=UPI00104FB5EE|nr:MULTISPECIES: beta-galactosidase [unclassified Sphingobacterium]MCS3556151.1 beta-galactosidase [Sphingobacterium sp. JUb21]TCR08527.1 beta-galactosidase [Sphingobacterium sp. JUb20]
MKKLFIFLFFLLFLTQETLFAQAKHSFEIKNGSFIYDGKPVQIHSGEMHYSRIPKPYWRHRLKMIKAMGLNTVATYVFWNYHETAPGVWDFKSGNRDLAEYIKIAGEEGLMVILRPGPYVCGEWEFGGYPWWLQKTEGLTIRGNNKLFLDACKIYIDKVLEQVKHLQITNGGPIIMVQAENEYGSYAMQQKDIPLSEHRAYTSAIKHLLINAGVNVPLYTSDGSGLFEAGKIDGALPAANGESNVANLKKAVNEHHNGIGPYMAAEFYPGWIDHWSEKFEKIATEGFVKQLDKYLKDTVSFNFYMAHGGTNFGFTSGANYNNDHPIQPDITSYDYDSPINEPGWITPKYTAIRNKLKEYVKYAVPEPPHALPVIEIPSIKLTKAVNLFDITEKMTSISNDEPLSFEDLNQGYGYVLYSRNFKQPVSGKLEIKGLRDYAIVYIDDKKIGELNRYNKTFSINIDIPFNAVLKIVVENMGRINYGPEILNNKKGIISNLTINDLEITGDWEMYNLPMDKSPVLTDFTNNKKEGVPLIYQGSFTLEKTGDTFLDMTNWGKGIVFVNGINLGRYWNVGPQQTLYLPGCWLKKGNNEIVIFEQQNDQIQTELRSVKTPILEALKN